MHGGGSDLNTSSQRSGDKERERARPGCCQEPQKKGGGGGRESHLKYWCVHVRSVFEV